MNEDSTCNLEDQPYYLRFNSHIKTGYRPLGGIKHCLKSLFNFHNETANIYTHGIPFLYFLIIANFLYTPTIKLYSRFLAFTFWFGSFLPFFGSVCYHTFMCHKSGHSLYKLLLRLDILGIWSLSTLASIPSLFIPFACFPLIRNSLLLAHFAISSFLFWRSLFTNSKKERIIGLTIQYAYRLIFHLSRMLSWTGGDNGTIPYLVLSEALVGPGALINAFNFPEKYFFIKGRLIYILNSHTIMHVMGVLGVYFAQKAILLDIQWLEEVQCIL